MHTARPLWGRVYFLSYTGACSNSPHTGVPQLNADNVSLG